MTKYKEYVHYSDEVAVAICASVAEGRSLTRTLKEPGMPHITVVYRWLQERPDFFKMYEKAREDQADTLADQIQDAANELERMANDKEKPPLAAQVQAHKVRLDALIWTAAKLKPKKYSERQQVDVTQTSYKDVLEALGRKEEKAAKRGAKAKPTRAKVGEVGKKPSIPEPTHPTPGTEQ